MNTKMNAIAMTLLMIASALAGCTSGDPDGDGTSGIDMEILNEMIDDNLQDFINNTSVTINQEIHYHNNTTVVNNYDEDTTWNMGGASFGEGVNGSISGSSMMFVAHLEFTAMDLFPDYEMIDYRNNSFSYQYTYYDYLTNADRTDTFTFNCQVYYLIGSQSNNSNSQVSYWENSDNYWNAWDNEYNSTIANMLQDAAYVSNVRTLCDDNIDGPIKDGTDGWNYNFLTIDIPQGYAVQYIQLETEHTWHGCYWYELDDYRCTDSFYWQDHTQGIKYDRSEGPWLSEENHYYGGWENISIEFEFRFSVYNNVGQGDYSIWPTSEYELTLYYRFVPVIPIE